MPAGHLLKLVSGLQQFRFFQVVTHQLQANGHAAFAKSGRHAHAGQTSQADRQSKNIGKIAGDRVIGLFTQMPSDRRCDRPSDDIALLECRLEVVGNQTSNFFEPADSRRRSSRVTTRRYRSKFAA